MTVKFYAQRDKYSCGAVATLNILKWKDPSITYKHDFRQIKRKVKCDRDGTNTDDVLALLSKDKELKLSKLKPRLTPSRKLKEISTLNSKFEIILFEIYYWNLKTGKENGHLALITNTTDQFVKFANIMRRENKSIDISIYSKSNLLKMLKGTFKTKTDRFKIQDIYFIERI